jgi:hypothetical protein
MEQGVRMINGSDPIPEMRSESPPRSRSVSPKRALPGAPAAEPQKEKRFLNGWSKEQERLMAEWSDLAMCYRWLHDKSEKHFHGKNLWINLPVIVLTTLGGTANFGIQSLFDNDTSKKYASFAIGGISLFAGLLTTIGNYLRYAQLEEAHRVASIAWGKFQRLIAVELAMKPDDRIDSLDFLKICRADLDRLIEQSPPIPQESIDLFESEFGSIADLKKPDICGALEHTRVFESSELRLKQVASEAALLLRHKRNALNELLSPQIQDTIKKQIDNRLKEALEERKKTLAEEIELEKSSLQEQEEEYNRILESRHRRIRDSIEAEIEEQRQSRGKSVITEEVVPQITRRKSNFENRLQFKQNPLFSRGNTPEKTRPEPANQVVIPSSEEPNKEDVVINM